MQPRKAGGEPFVANRQGSVAAKRWRLDQWCRDHGGDALGKEFNDAGVATLMLVIVQRCVRIRGKSEQPQAEDDSAKQHRQAPTYPPPQQKGNGRRCRHGRDGA